MYALAMGVAFFSGIIGIGLGHILQQYGTLLGAKIRLPACQLIAVTASGFLTAVSCFVLLPEAFLIQGVGKTLLWTMTGLILMLFFEQKELWLACFFLGMALSVAPGRDSLATVSLVLSIFMILARYRLREKESSLGAWLFYSLLLAGGGVCGLALLRWESTNVAPIYSLCSGAIWYLCANGKQKRS